MKFHTILVLVFSQLAVADYPADLVSSDAMAILSLKNGKVINSTFESIQDQLTTGNQKPDVLDGYLGLLLDDPSAVDLSEQVILTLQPTILSADQKPAGMFGPMPHLVLICKPIEGRKLAFNNAGMLKTSGMYEGWFVASGSDSWSPPSTEASSFLLSKLPKGQVSFAANFELIWKQFGPITQMMGGMLIGTMNKPGPTGVIAPETKRQTAATNAAFRKLMKFCSQLELVTAGIKVVGTKLSSEMHFSLKDQEDMHINNASLEEMASLLADDAIQYGMSGWLTRTLISYEFDALKSIGLVENELPMMVVTQSMQELVKLQEENVVAYGLNETSGLTVSVIAVSSDQNSYLAMVPTVIDDASEQLKNEFQLQFIPDAGASDTWDVQLLGEAPQDKLMMKSFFPEEIQLRVGKQGSDKITFALGPDNWKPFFRPHSTSLSQLIKSHDDVSIDFAMCMDVRRIAKGFIDIGRDAGFVPQDVQVALSPSAKSSLVFGRDSIGWAVDFEVDLLGLATLMGEIKEQM